MNRFLIGPLAALALAVPVGAKVMAPQSPVMRAIHSEVVVLGKVTAIEKEPVEVKPFPEAPNAIAYTVAVIKIEDGLAGTTGLTHLKVGFIPPPPPAAGAPVRPATSSRRPNPFAAPNLAEAQEGLFFLTKHPTAGFYMFAPMAPPLLGKEADHKAEVAAVKQAMAALADPLKALKAQKPADRAAAAAVLVMKYRTGDPGGHEVEPKPISEEESRLILKGLLEADWAGQAGGINTYQAFAMLGLRKEDGWKDVKPAKNENYMKATQAAFAKWMDGPGKHYRVKKLELKDK